MSGNPPPQYQPPSPSQGGHDQQYHQQPQTQPYSPYGSVQGPPHPHSSGAHFPPPPPTNHSSPGTSLYNLPPDQQLQQPPPSLHMGLFSEPDTRAAAGASNTSIPPPPPPSFPTPPGYSQPKLRGPGLSQYGGHSAAAPGYAAPQPPGPQAPHVNEAPQQWQQQTSPPPPVAVFPVQRGGGTEDLLSGDSRAEEDPEARMQAMVDAAARAKAAGSAAAGLGPSSMASTSRDQRQKSLSFVVGSPRYRVRTALLFAAGLFGMIPLMSTFALTVLLCGVVVVYMADYLGHVRGTVLALLGTSIAFGSALLLSNLHAAVTSFGPMLMIVDLTGLLLMATAACLLHFRWLQETRSDIVYVLERCVMSVTPILVLPSLLTTSIALVGSRYGPFAFLAAMCALHYVFFGPLTSSFLMMAVNKTELQYYMAAYKPGSSQADKSDKEKRREEERRLSTDLPSTYGDVDDELDSGAVALVPQQLNDRSHAAVFTLMLLLVPTLLYNGLQTNWEDHVLANLLNSLGLVCGAFVYLCITPSHTLWFLAPPPEQLKMVSGDNASGQGAEDPELNPETVALLLAYDPLGLQLAIKKYRTRALILVALFGVCWAAYRLTHSRYSYLFDGLPYPFNLVCLLAALTVSAFLAIEIFVLMAADSAGEDVSRGKYVARRGGVVVGSIVVVVLFCMLSSTPGVFYFLGILSVTSLNVFLIDRSNAGPMVSFTVFSALLLLWWMYRTFSFIVVELRVLNGTGTVSSAVVGVSVLWSYVLGCLCFLFSFSKTKVFLVVFVLLHSLELMFVEEVLVAQKEEGAYPAVLALFTSALGVLIGYRFYKNEVLGIQGAAFVASCYAAKVLTLLVETTGGYYSGEMEEQYPDLAKVVLACEVSVSWWASLMACSVATVFEIERRKKLAAREVVRLPYVYLLASVLIAACTVRNVQRAVYEFFTQSYVAADELPHIAIGTACLTFALLTWPFFSREAQRYPHLRKYATLGKLVAIVGVLLLAVQPTRITESHVSLLDYELVGADKGRYAAAFGLGLLMSSRVIPMHRLPLPVRVVYWLTTAILLAFSITAQLLPVPTLPLFGCMMGFVFLMLLVVDIAHNRELSSVEGWVVYGLSFCVMIGSFVMVGRVDLVKAARGNMVLVWEMHEQGRIQLLSIVAVVNLFVAVVLRFRFAGKPLLPNCVPMTAAIASQVGVMCNYATLFAVCTLSVLNFWANQSEPFIYVTLSLFLLLLVDDGLLFFDLHLRNYRYFPCVVFSLATLWLCLFYHGWTLSVSKNLPFRIFAMFRSAAHGLPLLPAQLSLLADLYNVDAPAGTGTAKPGVRGPAGGGRQGGQSKVVLATMLLSVVVLLYTSSATLTWMAIVCICGQCARLFGHSLSTSGTAPRKSTS